MPDAPARMTTIARAGPCEACERRASSVAESADDPGQPYLVCSDCRRRLLARSLRPREWFNLARRHGWAMFLLHDDFYDEDGNACQPDEDVEDADALRAPTLEESAVDAESLLDYAITRWQLDDAVVERWRRLPAAGTLAVLDARFDATRNANVRAVVLELAAHGGDAAAELVRRAWRDAPQSVPWDALVQATAGCLPLAEGFLKAEAALAAMSGRAWRESFPSLAHFRSDRALDWIETHAGEPSTEAWGHLAAASALDWPRVRAWLERGRPLNLFAIDALLAIAHPRTPHLLRLRPALGSPPGEAELRCVLEAALAADPVPRVQQRVSALLAALPVLAGGAAA
jgi:hypothetical protein